MTTRPLGPPAYIPDDPGPWSVVTHVFHQAGRPGRRRPQPPSGLMLSPPPTLPLPMIGIDPGAPVAGAGVVRVVAAAREPAFSLFVDPESDLLHGVSPYVRRAWSLPDLTPELEERPGDDPAAGVPDPAPAATLGHELPPPIAEAPGGELIAVTVREARFHVVAIVRRSDGGVVRWIRGARSAAWSGDGRLLAVGGEWGVLLLAPHRGPDD